MTGTGGVGKTRLVAEALSELSDQLGLSAGRCRTRLRHRRAGRRGGSSGARPSRRVAGRRGHRGISLAGNNATLIAAGLTLGTLSGVTTSIWRRGNIVAACAGLLAAFLWVLGMGARFAFAVWATHSGAAAIGHFSARTDITGAHT